MKHHARLLLVEDDATTRTFMRAVLDAAGFVVDEATCAADAVRAARDATHDLWLVDAHLPDSAGDALLARLRLARPATAAIAHTASNDPALRRRLLDAGFAAVLLKPLASSALIAAVNGAIDARAAAVAVGADGGTPGAPRPIWDEAAALAALNGQAAMVATLRALFIEELPGQLARIRQAFASGDLPAVRAETHRLLGSCGFVGAARLRELAQAAHSAPGPATLAELARVGAATLATCPGMHTAERTPAHAADAARRD